MSDALERFLRYVQIDTQSDDRASGSPSTPGQLVLAHLLETELAELECVNIRLSPYGYLFADLPAAPGCEKAPVLGLIAHLDTSNAASGAGVRPRIIRWEGKPAELGEGRILDPARFPELQEKIGCSLVVADGTTLLGADDKAGIAEIMGALHALRERKLPHGALRIAFTPDEEICRGTEHFDVADFGADFAYTVDGSAADCVNYENFNAACAVLRFTGVSVHPGDAYGIMVNALQLAQEFDRLLPAETPATTRGREGFYHLYELTGSAAAAEAHYLLRDHDGAKFAERREVVTRTAAELNRRLGYAAIEVQITEQYRNMREVLEARPEAPAIADRAVTEICGGVQHRPIRGGTDGAALSFRGLPCPNLGTGGGNFHGEYEYLCVEDMDRMVAILLRIIALTAEGKRN